MMGGEPENAERPEWGRLSRPDARVLECASISRGDGIVPATQPALTLTHVEPAPPADNRAAPQSHSLMPLLSEKHLRRALRQCGRRSSSPGADRMTWRDLRQQAGVVLPNLAAQLAAGTWRPGPLRELTIPTYTGKSLPTAIPTVVDRLVHRAVRNAVEPALDARAFADWVSGYRPRRNRNTALRQAAGHLAAGHRYVADIDAARVSDGVDVDETVHWFAEYIHDGACLRLLRTLLAGLPSPVIPGSGLAPLLINLRLSQVDKPLSDLRIVRFADNYCAFAETMAGAEKSFWRISDAMAAVRLEPNAAKSRIRRGANAEDLFLIDG
ncbi:hypothetical protein GCM10025762_18240 [Haloechinothrix salitolerans]